MKEIKTIGLGNARFTVTVSSCPKKSEESRARTRSRLCWQRDKRPEENTMNRIVIVARLKQGKHSNAEKVLGEGPPFEPEELGFHRHGVYLTSTEVIFVFEAPEVEWIVNELINDPVTSAAFGPWHALIEGTPHIAHERYYWSSEESNRRIGLGA
jgi:hypothetical protein